MSFDVAKLTYRERERQDMVGFLSETILLFDEVKSMLEIGRLLVTLPASTRKIPLLEMRIPLCLTFRDDLTIIRLDKVACLVAEGNYTKVNYMCGSGPMITISITKAEEALRSAWPMNLPCPMVRVGRSLVINRELITAISVPQRKLVLSDCDGHEIKLTVFPKLLKDLKHLLSQFYHLPQQSPQEEEEPQEEETTSGVGTEP